MDLNYQKSASHSLAGSHKIEEGMSVQFIVSHIDAEENLLKVWVQMDTIHLHRINEYMEKMKGILEQHAGYKHQRQLTLGNRYFVKPIDGENWYRAVVLKHPPTDAKLVVVHYIDYGHTGIVRVEDVRLFDERIFNIVPQATKCIVAGVASSTGEAWSKQAVEYLVSTLRNKEFIGTVVNVFRDIPYIQIMINNLPLSHHLIEKRLGVPIGSSTVQTTPMILSGIETYRALPLDANQEQLVYVSHIESTQKFYIQLACKEPELNTLMEQIDQYASEHGFYPLEQGGLLPGTPCVTQFSDDRAYYRAIVTTVMGNNCRVTYVDYGNSEIKCCSELKAVPRQFLLIPAQARECALSTDIMMDINMFRETVDDKVLGCRIVGQQGTTYFVMLFSDGMPISGRNCDSSNNLNYTTMNLSLGSTHNIFVTHIHGPLRFYCQLAQNTTVLESLMDDISSIYKKLETGAYPVCANECKQGMPVCAKFMEDELWYRAVVLTPAIQNTVAVQFVDYGNEDKVDLNNIKRITPNLMQLPIQGLPLSLSNLETFPTEVLESDAVIEELEKLTLNIQLVAKVEAKTNDVYSVSLFNISSLPPVCINSELEEFIQMSNARNSCHPVSMLNSMTVNPLLNEVKKTTSKATKDVSYDDLYPLLSEGTLEEVIVTDCLGPESFYCQLQRDSSELDALMDDLAEHYNILSENEETLNTIVLGSLCVAKYTVDDNWYRAKVVGLLRSGGIEVLYVDYGNREQINTSRIKMILPQFLLLPFKAVECTLANFDTTMLQSSIIESFNSTVLDATFTAVFQGRKGYIYDVELVDSQENKIGEKFQQMCKPKLSNNWEPEKMSNNSGNRSNTSWSPKRNNLEPEKQTNNWEPEKQTNNWEPEKQTNNWEPEKQTNNWEPEKSSFVPRGSGGTWNTSPKTTSGDNWDCNLDSHSGSNVWNVESVQVKTANSNNINDAGDAEVTSQASKFDNYSGNKPYRKDFREPHSFDNDTDKDTRRQQDDRGRKLDRMPYRDRRKQFGESSFDNERSSSGSRGSTSRSPKGNQTSFRSDSFGDNSFSHYNKNNFKSVKEITEYKEIDIPCGSFRYINILHVVNPNEFYCQLVDHTSELSLVMEQIGQDYGALCDDELSLNNPQTGKVCCALFSKDCAWYRAKIRSVVDNFAEVFFVDYGNLETVSLSSIKILKQEFLNLPMQTLKCSCLGIKPEGESWSEKDISTFKDMAEEKSLLAQFVSKENDTVFLVNLIPVDKLKEGMLNKEFLNSGHGKKEEMGSPQLKVPYSASLQANLVKPVLNNGERAEVAVTWAFSVDMFFCQLTSFISQFQDMMNSIQKEYNNMSELEAVIDRPQINAYCMSQFSEDGVWYRAKIMHLKGNDISVYYVDYGNNEIVRRRSIKYILPQFTTLPTQAIKCTLNGIKASSTTINEDIFQKYFVGNIVCRFVTDCDDHYIVDLENDGKSVAQLLANDRLAVPAGDMKFEIPKDNHIKLIPKLDLTEKKGKLLEVVLSYIESPYKFWCQLTSESEKLNKIASMIESHYSLLDSDTENATNIQEGDPCIAKFTEDELWYRAIVKNFQNDKAEVLFVDYGNGDLVLRQQIKIISAELMLISAQAILCTLSRIPPTLTDDQQDKFAEFVDGQTMVIQPVDVNSDGALVVMLFDNSSDPKVNIAEKLYGELLEDVPALLYPHSVPEGLVDGYISLVNSVSEFYVQLVSDEEDIYRLKDDLTHYYDAISPEDLLIENPTPQMACCSKYTEDSCWYRAVIISIDGEQCTIHFVDFGNTEVIPLNEIKTLKEEFLVLPCLALRCYLKGVEPISGDTWSTSANDWLFEFTQEKTLQIHFYSNNEPLPVTLLVDGGDIADNMVSAELATRIDEIEVEVAQEQSEETKVSRDERLAVVSHVKSAESFYVTFADKSDELYNFYDKLQETFNDDSDQLIDCTVSQKCVAKFSEDEAWYRSEVTEVSGETVTVRFIDYGNSEVTTKDKLKIIQSDLLSVEPFAVECTLFELKPNPLKLKEAKVLLQELTQDEEVKLEIIGGQQPCCVKVKINDKCISSELLESELYMKTPSVSSNLEKTEHDLNISLHEDTSHIEKNENTAIVPYVVSAELFYVTFSDKLDEFFDFHENLQQIYNDKSDHLIDCTLSQKCVVKRNEDEAWCRAEVMELSEEFVLVRFLDYGNLEMQTKDNLKIVYPDLLSPDPFATACTLHGLKAKQDCLEEAKTLLTALILEKYICIEIIEEQQPLSVNVKVDGNSIASQLLQSGLFVETCDISNVGVDKLYTTVPLGKHIVAVSHCLSPFEFYVQLCDNLPELNILSEKISENYAENTSLYNLADTTIGQTCIAFDSFHQRWARALITEENEREVEVTFVDYGNNSCVSRDSVKLLLPELQKLSFQCVKCTLGGICPIGSDNWNEEACAFFQELVKEKVLTAEFQEKKHCYVVKLFDNDDVEDIIVEKGMAAYKKTSDLQRSSEYLATENAYTDESDDYVKDLSINENLPDAIASNLDSFYDKKVMSEYSVAENASIDETNGYAKENENLHNTAETALEFPYDKDMELENLITDNADTDENSIKDDDNSKVLGATEENLEFFIDDVKSSKPILPRDENNGYQEANLEAQFDDEVYKSDEDYDEGLPSEELEDNSDMPSMINNETGNVSESLEISGSASVYVSAEDYSIPVCDGNMHGISLETEKWLGESGPSLKDENSSDAVDSKDLLEIPCESSPKHGTVNTSIPREEKIVPGQVSYIEIPPVQHETTSDGEHENSLDFVNNIATRSTDEPAMTEAVDKEINESKLGICSANESPSSAKECGVNDATPFQQTKLREQLQNLELCKVMESSPKDTCIDTEDRLSECDHDSGTGNTSFATSSAANSTTEAPGESSHSASTSGTSEQGHDEMHNKSVEQKIALGSFSFSDNANDLCEISAYNNKENITDRTIVGHVTNTLETDESDKSLQTLNISAEDKIVPGQLSYFTDTS